MKFNYKHVWIFLSIGIVILISIFFSFNNYPSYKELPKVKEKEQNELDSFALMLEQEDGKYIQSNNDLPTEGYTFNQEKSGCVDLNGKIIPDVIEYSYENYTLTLSSSKSSYCYLYYDLEPNISSLRKYDYNKTLSNEIIDGLYRYQGDATITNLKYNNGNSVYKMLVDEIESTDEINNYICLGDDCTKYGNDIYRIIGITSKGELKVLKKTALESFYKWYTDKTSNIPYSESLLFKALNSNSDSFLTTLDTTLKDNIVEYNWKDDIIKIDEEKLQLIDNAIAETDSENESELKRLYDEYEKIYLDAFKKEKEDVQNKVNAKIGLISITDFCNSFSSFDKCFRSFIGLKVGDTSILQTNWMSLSSNDQKVGYEWTNNYYGYFSLNGLHIAWYVSNVSCIYTGDMPMNGYLRPVFYLSNNVRIIDGNGSLENPFKLNI